MLLQASFKALHDFSRLLEQIRELSQSGQVSLNPLCGIADICREDLRSIDAISSQELTFSEPLHQVSIPSYFAQCICGVRVVVCHPCRKRLTRMSPHTECPPSLPRFGILSATARCVEGYDADMLDPKSVDEAATANSEYHVQARRCLTKAAYARCGALCKRTGSKQRLMTK